MTPPPIRYPLPSMLAALALGLAIAWAGPAARTWLRAAAIGPPVPASTAPQRRPGGIARGVLLLRDGVEATERPGGKVAEVIRRRGRFAVYDTWPAAGPSTHYRIGNRRPLGWVAAADALPWDTRLAIKPPAGRLALEGGSVDVDGHALPVVDWRPDAIRVAAWAPGRAWSAVGKVGWLPMVDVPAGWWTAVLGDLEVRRLLGDTPTASPDAARLGALVGIAADPSEVGALRDALPGPVFDRGPADAPTRREALLKLYEAWPKETSWGGFEFVAVPVGALP